MQKYIILIVSAIVVWFLFFKEGEVSIGPGVYATDAPEQKTKSVAKTFQVNGYTLTEIASFKLKAKVLSKKNYSLGRETDLSPVDLALGWGRMSDESVINNITFSQSNRWYYWRTDAYPIPRREIETSSANMHMIPANEFVEDALKSVKKGDIIQLIGSLVNVEANDGWRWRSSVTRTDTGGGSCELIWVENFSIVTP
ncbi:hypothetical protein [Zooshikella harenae]|uniref:Uncharacterized protein n=1 Tax=Zooshikella harenae TaxID=2827238 RepID=A0ABS5ZIX1_9GAMM|nr:hypothetical protein [Zooshikella harenae]MBU2714026.1 hypothetical protein [Zooshikella harenae]